MSKRATIVIVTVVLVAAAALIGWLAMGPAEPDSGAVAPGGSPAATATATAAPSAPSTEAPTDRPTGTAEATGSATSSPEPGESTDPAQQGSGSMVPDVADISTVEEAVGAIRAAGLTPYALVVDEQAKDATPGSVVGTLPAKGYVPEDGRVTILIAPERASAKVRTVTGMVAADAIAQLRMDGVRVRNVASVKQTAPAPGEVADTYPKAGKSAAKGVALAIVEGAPVTAFDVAGMSPTLASWLLLGQGLQPSFVGEDGKAPAPGQWTVTGSSKQATAGASIQVTVKVDAGESSPTSPASDSPASDSPAN